MPTFTSTSGADNPNNVERDRHGRYLIPKLPSDYEAQLREHGKITPDPKAKRGTWTRVSTIAKALEDGFGISAWQRRLVVKGLGLRPDLYALACATRIDDRDQLDNIAEQAHDAAGGKVSSNLGTALHSFTDRIDQGEKPSEDFVIPEPWASDVAAYQAALAEHGIELMPGYQEMRVVIPELAEDGKTGGTDGAAGTFDRIVMWRGRPTVADLKSGRDPLTHGDLAMSIQLGRYATAAAIWDGESFHPMPEGIRTDVGLVIWLPAGKGKCEVHEIDLNPGHEIVAEAVMRTRTWRKMKGKLHRKLEPDSAEVESWKPETVVTETVGNPARFERTPQMIEDQATADRRLAVVQDRELESKMVSGPDRSNGTEPWRDAAQPDGGLAPLAGPGERGCSVCGRKGHRKGSVKCLGADDPARKIMAGVHREEESPAEKPHAHRDWTRDAMTGKWVCGICGELGAEPIHSEPASETEADPFEDDEPEQPADPLATPEAVIMADLSGAQTKAEIRDIRERAKAAGIWGGEVLAHAMKQLDRLG